MKKFDYVKIVNWKDEYSKKHLEMATERFGGFMQVVEVEGDVATLLLYNGYQYGDYAFYKVPVDDLDVVKYKSDVNEIEKDHLILDKLLTKIDKNKDFLDPTYFEEVSTVEIVQDRKKYLKYGVSKGAIATVACDYSVQGECLVEFDTKKFPLLQDSMGLLSVKLCDLKLVWSPEKSEENTLAQISFDPVQNKNVITKKKKKGFEPWHVVGVFEEE